MKAPSPSLSRPMRLPSRPSENRLKRDMASKATAPAIGPIDVHAPDRSGSTQFILRAPGAQRVQLVSDFTAWEKHPLDLVRNNEGDWQLTLVLPPGRYGYRFLVDGVWFDEPRDVAREPNPFGSMNAVVEVK